MEIYKAYKHDACTDVALYVHKVWQTPDDCPYIKVKGLWLNVVNPKNIYLIENTGELRILREDLDRWRKIEYNGNYE